MEDVTRIIHIAVNGKLSELDEKTQTKIDLIMNDLFGNSNKRVSITRETVNVEIIYEIQTPILDGDEVQRDFYSNLEVLLDELHEFNPHFTQFRKG